MVDHEAFNICLFIEFPSIVNHSANKLLMINNSTEMQEQFLPLSIMNPQFFLISILLTIININHLHFALFLNLGLPIDFVENLSGLF